MITVRTPSVRDVLPVGSQAMFTSSVAERAAVWDVDAYDEVSVSVHVGEGVSWPTSLVLTVEVSNDGEKWETNTASGSVTFSAAGVTGIYYVRVYRYVRVRISTASSGGTQDVRACVYGRSAVKE